MWLSRGNAIPTKRILSLRFCGPIASATTSKSHDDRSQPNSPQQKHLPELSPAPLCCDVHSWNLLALLLRVTKEQTLKASILEGIPQGPNTSRFQDESGLCQWFSNPAHSQSPQNMAVRHDDDVSFRVLTGPLSEAVALVFSSDFGNECVQSATYIFR